MGTSAAPDTAARSAAPGGVAVGMRVDVGTGRTVDVTVGWLVGRAVAVGVTDGWSVAVGVRVRTSVGLVVALAVG